MSGGRAGPVEGARDGPAGEGGGGQQPVHGPRGLRDRRESGAGGRHESVPRVGPPQGAQRGDTGEEVPEPEGAQDEEAGRTGCAVRSGAVMPAACRAPTASAAADPPIGCGGAGPGGAGGKRPRAVPASTTHEPPGTGSASLPGPVRVTAPARLCGHPGRPRPRAAPTDTGTCPSPTAPRTAGSREESGGPPHTGTRPIRTAAVRSGPPCTPAPLHPCTQTSAGHYPAPRRRPRAPEATSANGRSPRGAPTCHRVGAGDSPYAAAVRQARPVEGRR
ncbi:hypothetical protein GCM10010309_10890 [Streptomyces violaceochromogenes]|nr:hypothetical protein GCM10010309_10890 [Streptomyces violaceochromogenes]